MTKKNFSFTLEATKGKMRVGVIKTQRGEIKTPMFMPVGTLATVKSLDTKDINDLRAPIILGNTYHLYLRPGMERLQAMGGVHQFMGWDKPILTDSGGFQVFSLGRQQLHSRAKKKLEQKLLKQPKQLTKNSSVKISEQGVEFVSHLDGSKHFFSPESVIEIQRKIGADIIMVLDECVSDNESKEYVKKSIDRTHRWAKRCYDYWKKNKRQSVYGDYQALFGIIQGAMYEDLRKESAEFITSLDFDGIAVGGETTGYNMSGTRKMMGWIEDMLPANKPRYAMGLGRDPQDLIDAVSVGFDMFDCIGPTRLARNGALYNGKLVDKNDKMIGGDREGTLGREPKFESEYKNGRLNIGNQKFSTDKRVIQEDCDCYTCINGYSRGYLNHLYRTKELTYYRLASIHNVRFMVRLAENLRIMILNAQETEKKCS
ncbi:tRNA guanosine(34) transglycosylase Tgt [Patescibacteria group bacterium]|nr:tRNA guanosine(34) transglycosylase Tgt [Patescibacteria group bacterium]